MLLQNSRGLRQLTIILSLMHKRFKSNLVTFLTQSMDLLLHLRQLPSQLKEELLLATRTRKEVVLESAWTTWWSKISLWELIKHLIVSSMPLCSTREMVVILASNSRQLQIWHTALLQPMEAHWFQEILFKPRKRQEKIHKLSDKELAVMLIRWSLELRRALWSKTLVN